ncbi:YetF domain-containing protein [Peribacillus butanolivorans]|uniref:YetF domain-containing protein n=1 Tax=Peribacillus butanolivorans TaxID=421767 RepID=UPI001CBC6651|nr:YetF domain-containing protein [Peribacillus butanolivorans]
MTTETTVIMIFIGTLLIHPVIGENLWVTFAIATILIGTLLLIEYISINEKNLIKLRLSVDALEMLLRQNGIENIKDVQWATIEPSGQLGYLLTNNKKFATKEDIEKIQHALTQLHQIKY